MEKRLHRSRSDRMIGGVCGGLAQYFDMDPTIVRLIFVLLLFANGLSLLAYIIMVIVVPIEGSKTAAPKETIKENVKEIKEAAQELSSEIHSTISGQETSPEASVKVHRQRNLIGIALIVIGVLTLMGTSNLFWWFRWGYLWPLILIVVGLIIIFGAKREK